MFLNAMYPHTRSAHSAGSPLEATAASSTKSTNETANSKLAIPKVVVKKCGTVCLVDDIKQRFALFSLITKNGTCSADFDPDLTSKMTSHCLLVWPEYSAGTTH
jgi:hypothetical protein